ncbi:Ribonuclease HI [Sporomusa rhizae]|uniref:ribonuclease HI n=1 Tax=Sporomusa rhizae TaxID=357999 RepID=UPI00352A00BE
MDKVEIYTDGACSGNPGPGGWGAILIYKGVEKELSGYESHTTNNRMELMGPIKALEALKRSCEIVFYTDSAYVCKAFTDNWVKKWQMNNWQTSKKLPVENQDLWMALIDLLKSHNATWVKVKGHSDNAKNNRCDLLARTAIKNRM